MQNKENKEQKINPVDMAPEKAVIGRVTKKAGQYLIAGPPVAQVRHSVAVKNGKARAFYGSAKYKNGKNTAVNTIKLQHWSDSRNLFIPKGIGVSLKMLYVFPRPQRLKKAKSDPGFIAHTVKPDLDNLDKLYVDALAEVVLNDDNQVFAIESKKVFCSYDHLTKTEGWNGIKIEVYCIDNAESQKLFNDYLPW